MEILELFEFNHQGFYLDNIDITKNHVNLNLKNENPNACKGDVCLSLPTYYLDNFTFTQKELNIIFKKLIRAVDDFLIDDSSEYGYKY